MVGKFLLGMVTGGILVTGGLVVGSVLFPTVPANDNPVSTATEETISAPAATEADAGEKAEVAPETTATPAVEPAPAETAPATSDATTAPESTAEEATTDPVATTPAPEPAGASADPDAAVTADDPAAPASEADTDTSATLDPPALPTIVPQPKFIPEIQPPATTPADEATETVATAVPEETATLVEEPAVPEKPAAIADEPAVAAADSVEPDVAPAEAATEVAEPPAAAPETIPEATPETAPLEDPAVSGSAGADEPVKDPAPAEVPPEESQPEEPQPDEAVAEAAPEAPTEAPTASAAMEPADPAVADEAEAPVAVEPAPAPEVPAADLNEPPATEATAEPPAPNVAAAAQEPAPEPETAPAEAAPAETAPVEETPAVVEPPAETPDVAPDDVPDVMPEAGEGTKEAADAENSETFKPTPGFGAKGEGAITDRDAQEEVGEAAPPDGAVEADAAPVDTRPIVLYATPFENPDAKPPMAIVLIDDGKADLDRQAIAALPFPVSIALDPLDPATPERVALYRGAGKEVVMLVTGIAEGSQASDVEVAFQSMELGLPEAVAVMDLAENRFQNNRLLSGAIIPILLAQGRGLLTWDVGLNAADQVARREDLAATVVFKDLGSTGTGTSSVRRLLDRAVFKAGQDGRVTVTAEASSDMLTALLEWTVEGRSASVILAPLTATLKVD